MPQVSGAGPNLPRAISVTHRHILGVLVAELEAKLAAKPETLIRILDVGCGNGELIRYLYLSLKAIFPSVEFVVCGLDIVDFGVQAQDFHKKSLEQLTEFAPDVAWADRVKFISHTEPWPFEPTSMDVVLSNQVLEHVIDHSLFFTRQKLVMKEGAFAVHLFPLREAMWEAHLHLPFVHKIQNWDRLQLWIQRFSQIGFGKWKRSGMDLADYSAGHADYLLYYTNYKSRGEMLGFSKRVGLRASFAYTSSFYLRKLSEVLHIPTSVRSRTGLLLDIGLLPLFERVASITLIQRKSDTYRRFE